MNRYELTVILRNQEKDTLIDKTKEILEKHKAVIEKDDPWGTKRLAYEIDGEREGYYFFAIVQSMPETVKKITTEFGLNTGFLRSFFVKLPDQKTV
ncbi:MAG: 30S ribosomal protein S6 [Leptospirales bacterium]|nr:30S ribosomal protein S6 [Leptospirales bacterium]